jgi:hypothetical protein
MGSPYGTRTLVHVVPYTSSTIKYGFFTNADGSTQTALGHTAITGAYPTGLVLGANAPKPGRATRFRATGVESSFVSATARTTAVAAGWKVSPGRVRNGASSTKSKTVYVTVESNKIAWKMPQFLYAKISTDMAALGILDATSADLDLVFGARYPRLPRVGKIEVPQSGAPSKLTTFCDPDALDTLPEGWTTVRASADRL